MAYKIGLIIVAVCLVTRIVAMANYWVDLQPSIPTFEETDNMKDAQVMVPSLPVGLNIPLEKLWSAVLKNPLVMAGGGSQPETIISPREEIFDKYFLEYISDVSPPDMRRSELRRQLLLDHLAHEFMPYSTMKEKLEQENNSNGILFLNLNGKAFNFTLNEDDMMLINGIQVSEVRSSEAEKGPIVYVIDGMLYDHLNIVKPNRNHQKDVNGTRMDGISYLEPSF